MRRILLLLFFATSVSAQFRERIDVVRILVDVRVTDYNGNPITGLTTQDFEVMIGGKQASVESVEWVQDVVDESTSRQVVEENRASPLDDSSTRRLVDSPGRLIIVFVQTDFARNSTRLRGHMDFLRYADAMVAAFAPEDRVAVFQFDSHLKFRLDFTTDKQRVRETLRETLRIESVPPPAPGDPSLTALLDRTAMKRATDSETGLLLVGNALRKIPGPKSLLLLGWGLGELAWGSVHMKREYTAAREALEASRTSIFALDTSWADYHTLEVGLMKAAEDTGGFYAKTFRFPQIAVERLQRTLTGHYELELRRPDDLERGTHALRIRVKRRGATLLAPASVTDR